MARSDDPEVAFIRAYDHYDPPLPLEFDGEIKPRFVNRYPD